MKRYWASWHSTYHVEDGCTAPPFQVWISGHSMDEDAYGIEVCSIVAVVDALNVRSVWQCVRNHFPDYRERFIEHVPNDYVPGDRFPGFEGKTSIVKGIN